MGKLMDEISNLLQLEQLLEPVERAAAGVLGVSDGGLEPVGEFSALRGAGSDFGFGEAAEAVVSGAFGADSGGLGSFSGASDSVAAPVLVQRFLEGALGATAGAVETVSGAQAAGVAEVASGAQAMGTGGLTSVEQVASMVSAKQVVPVDAMAASGAVGGLVEKRAEFFAERELVGQNQDMTSLSEQVFQEGQAAFTELNFGQSVRFAENRTAGDFENQVQAAANFFPETQAAAFFENVQSFEGDFAPSQSEFSGQGERWREIAAGERRAVSTEVHVNFGGITNHVAAEVDLDAMVEYIGEKTAERLFEVAEGVHR